MSSIARPRAHLLRDYDAYAAEFTQECLCAREAGAHVADADLQRLMVLARAVLDAVRGWTALAESLEFGESVALDVDRAAAIVLETVFDDILETSAWRVLAAGVALIADEGG
jgi:hypothetical protein